MYRGAYIYLCIFSFIFSFNILSFLFVGASTYTSGCPQNHGSDVVINGVVIQTDGAIETISDFVASFLAFNLQYNSRQEASLEAIDGRPRWYSKQLLSAIGQETD